MGILTKKKKMCIQYVLKEEWSNWKIRPERMTSGEQ